MTDKELWDTKWLALTLVLTGARFDHYNPRPSRKGFFSGEEILRCILQEDASGISRDSSVAKAIEYAGFSMDDYENLQKAGRRVANAPPPA